MTPAPAALPPPSTFSDRFWALAAAPEVPDDLPEPLRSIVIIRHFLAVLDHLAQSGRRAVPALGAILRAAELEGCLSYASPEQLRGEPLDTRSVVFTLGVVLTERLAGRHPFGAENNRPRRVERLRKGEYGSGVNSFPTIAGNLRAVLVRAMSPFPEERWPDLRPMRDLLAQFLAAEAPPPRLPGTATDTAPETTRVVRRPTDFGRELMNVVARHEPRPTHLRPATWPANPTPTTPQPPVRPQAGATARFGVVPLRPPAPPRLVTDLPPSDESVVTRVHEGVHDRPPRRSSPRQTGRNPVLPRLVSQVDPLAETVVLSIEDLDDDRAPSSAEVLPPIALPPTAPPRLPPAGPVAARLVAARVVIDKPVAVTFTGSTGAASADEPGTQLPTSRATGFDPGAVDLRPRSRSRTLAFGLASAAVGATAAAIAVMLLQAQPAPVAAGAATTAAPTSVEPAAAPTTPSPATAPTVAIPATPAVPAAAAAPAPAPRTSAPAVVALPPSAAPFADATVGLATAITPCLPGRGAHSTVFGLTVVPRKDGARAYFGADSLTPHERGCIVTAVRSAGEVTGTATTYTVRADGHGVAVTARGH